LENNKFKKEYLSYFESILGLTLDLNDDQSIKVINLPNIIMKINASIVTDLLQPIEELLKDEESLSKYESEKTFYKKILTTKYIYNIINPSVDINIIDDFVESLQSLSNKTYEQNNCQMGFILFNNPQENIKDELTKLDIEYIQFNEELSIKDVDSNKQSLKLVDSLSLSYVLNSSYKIIGLAKKRKSSQSISSIMSSRYNKDDESKFKYHMYRHFGYENPQQDSYEQEIFDIDNTIRDIKEQINKLNIETYKLQRELNYKKIIFNDDKLILGELAHALVNNSVKKEKLEVNLNELKIQQMNILEAAYAKKSVKNLNSNDIKNPNSYLVNKNIHYIQINSNKIEWFINDNLVCVLSNGKWRIQNYNLISHLILEYILRQFIDTIPKNEKFIEVINKIIPKCIILFNYIRSLSNKNIGALIVILEQSKQTKKTIFNTLLNNKKLDENEYKFIIKTEKSNSLNIHSCDSYLFELISSVDGAIILDRFFNILSFGEMINNSIETPPVLESGSRTLAAAKASRYGLSIKVSEDGDISLYEDGSPLIKL